MKRRHAQVERELKAEKEEAPSDGDYSSDEEGTSSLQSPHAGTGSSRRSPVRTAALSSKAASVISEGEGTLVEEDKAASLKKHVHKKLAVRIKSQPADTIPPVLPTTTSAGAVAGAAFGSVQFLEDFTSLPSEAITPRPIESRLDRLYIVMISLHGLVRGDHMELGRDSDTGGQVKYVVELAKAMSLHPAVYRVDLLTRMIKDPKVDSSYGEAEECLSKGRGELGGAYIVRLPCGPTEKYIRKELLWPHVREFADRGIAHASTMLTKIAATGRRCELYTIHGHYADAGEVAVLMASSLGVPMVMTGHSLGRNKLEHLLKAGTMTRAEVEDSYAISRRIEAEEHTLDVATMVFTSTQQEVEEQWGLYDGYTPTLARILRFRVPRGRSMPLMRVTPPGLDFSNLKIDIPEDPVLKEFEQQREAMEALDLISGGGMGGFSAVTSPRSGVAMWEVDHHRDGGGGGGTNTKTSSVAGSEDATTISKDKEAAVVESDRPSSLMLDATTGPPIWKEISRFLRNPLKPAILAMSRPDTKKNITTLVKAFGEHPLLRELANLVLIMGNRDNIDSMSAGSQKVLTQVLKLVDSYDLYGSVAYPKHHTQDDISDIYNFAKHTRGLFTNIALQEPFGLTVIEAAAHGVPTVATANGGPVDIMATLHHGVVVDPTNSDAVAEALVTILTNPTEWDTLSKNGHDNIMAYSWPSHCKRYLEALDAEKRIMKNGKKRHDRTLSGLLQFKKPASLAEGAGFRLEGIGGGGNGSEGGATPAGIPNSPAHSRAASSGALDIERYFSAPAPQSITTGTSLGGGSVPKSPLLGSLGSPPSMFAAGTGLGGPGRTVSGMSTDDIALLGASSFMLDGALSPAHKAAAAAGGDDDHIPMGYTRSYFIVVPIDSDVVASNAVRVLKPLQQAVEAAQLDVGFGVLSMLGFDSTRNLLTDSSIDVSSVDFIVCNAGADVWLRHRNGDWDADEGYEDLIEFEWDRVAIWRALNKIISAPVDNHRLPRLKELLYNIGIGEEEAVHPRHICLELDSETQNILSSGMGPRARQVAGLQLSMAVTERLKRRLRSKGFRATYTLQAVPDTNNNGEEFLSILHVTPVRASRSMALRYIMHRFGRDMAAVTTVMPSAEAILPPTTAAAHQTSSPSPPPSPSPDTAAATVGMYTNDAVDLLAGMQRVVCLTPPTVAAATKPFNGGSDSNHGGALVSVMGTSLKPWLATPERMVIVNNADEKAWIEAVLGRI